MVIIRWGAALTFGAGCCGAGVGALFALAVCWVAAGLAVGEGVAPGF